MAKYSRRHSKVKKHRRSAKVAHRRRQAGGGLGAGYGFTGPSSFDKLVNNSVVQSNITSCRAPEPMTLRPGFMPGGVTARGLPGMGGGARRNRRGGKQTRKQSGGRYGFDPSAVTAIGGTPWGSSYAPVSAIPCEASRSAIPLSGASGSLNVHQANTSGPQSGGSALLSYDMRAGVPSDFTPDRSPGSGAPGEIAMRAAYSDNLVAGGIDTAAGSKLMIHTPLNASQMNPACLKTGGGSRKNRSNKKKNSRKNRSNKKNRSYRKH